MADATPRAAFYTESGFTPGSQLSLSDADARHANVLRLRSNDPVTLRDGRGMVADGLLIKLSNKLATVEVESVREVAPPDPIHVMVPVADRDRMLWLAEKAAELNIASWRPVLWQRSRSVSPRGDGPTFRARVQTRMVGALLQSRSAWLPEIYPEATPDRACASAPSGARVVLDAGGAAVLGHVSTAPLTIAVGPEGGFEAAELELLASAGFAAVTLGASILRFETAAIAAVSIARAAISSTSSGGHENG